MRIALRSILAAFVVLGAATAQREIQPGPWTSAAKIPEGWVVHNTKNYHIQSQCGLDKAKRLGEHMEVMNVVYKEMFKNDKTGGLKLRTIKVFEDEKAFHRYGAPPGAGAYYSADDREMVCYDTGKWSDEERNGTAPKTAAPVTGETARERLARRLGNLDDMMKMDILGCAAHEGWHQYYHWMVVSRVALPSWINEGMGDYFYTAAPRGGKGKKADLGRMFDGRLRILQVAKAQGRMVPLEQFLRMLQQDYYSNPSICYAQGWAFCQFLLHGVNGKYAKLIPNYVAGVANSTNWESVHAKVFKGIDLAAMERDFHAYVDTLKPSVADPLEEEMEELEGEPGEPAPNGGGGGEPAGGGGNGGSRR
ncbi:MAG: DUF1570 domain-containing protein [Planctomycetes bacterium]|nr:DUF1570 domain-containing protein [Planctomycetota bacterium]